MSNNLNIFNLDEPVSGPAPRWKRKRDASSFATIDNNQSRTGTTPQKHAGKANISTSGKTPSSTTPGLNASLHKKTKTPKTPSADRFIPNRDAMNMEVSHHKVMNSTSKNDSSKPSSPSNVEYRKLLSESLNCDFDGKIIACKNKAPLPKEGWNISSNTFFIFLSFQLL